MITWSWCFPTLPTAPSFLYYYNHNLVGYFTIYRTIRWEVFCLAQITSQILIASILFWENKKLPIQFSTSFMEWISMAQLTIQSTTKWGGPHRPSPHKLERQTRSTQCIYPLSLSLARAAVNFAETTQRFQRTNGYARSSKPPPHQQRNLHFHFAHRRSSVELRLIFF